MNIQAERLEKQTARLTVEVEPERLEKAKQVAARKIAKQVRIPGFRKGKVPYHILVQRGLEPQILNDAVDALSQEVYRESITESEFEPYGPGAFEDFSLEPPTFIYTIPLQPQVDLKSYTEVRVDYEAPEVTDDDVNRALKQLQTQETELEEFDGPAALGHRLTVDVHSEYVDDPPESETEEESVPQKGDQFVHQHDAVFRLDPDDEPLLPGLNDALIGAEVSAEVEFDLTIPEDGKDFEEHLRGRRVHFHVTVKKIETEKLPELNDEFASKFAEGEEASMTLEQLRKKVHEDLFAQAESAAKNTYSTEVVDAIVAIAEIEYPDAMVEDQISAMIDDFEGRLQQQGMALETYYEFSGSSEEELRENYREQAVNSLRRGLVLREIAKQNELDALDEQVEARVNEVMRRFGPGAAQLRGMIDTPRMREMIASDLSTENALDFVSRLGRGEDLANFMETLKSEAEQAIVEFEAETATLEAEVEEDEATSDEPAEEIGEEQPDDESQSATAEFGEESESEVSSEHEVESDDKQVE